MLHGPCEIRMVLGFSCVLDWLQNKKEFYVRF